MQVRVPILDQCALSPEGLGDITIEALEPYLARNKDMVFPHRHNFFHFVIFTGGSGFFSIDFERFEVEEWKAYFMGPGQIHGWEFEGQVNGYVVNFELDTYQTLLLRSDFVSNLSLFSGLPGDSVCIVPAKSRQLIQEILDQAIQMRHKFDFLRVSLLYVLMLIQNQERAVPNQNEMSYSSLLLKNFRILVEKHYKEYRMPKDYASMLYITPNHLNALSKEMLGISAGEVIRNRILLEAKRLLVLQVYSISEIAYGLNFNDNSYFTKFFKKGERLTPEEFRMKYTKLS